MRCRRQLLELNSAVRGGSSCGGADDDAFGGGDDE
jgi:hypothetical protein